MSPTEYIDLLPITELQFDIMRCVDQWARTQKTPIPRTEIMKQMEEYKHFTVTAAINSLLELGYIRKAVTNHRNKSYYVQLRRV